MKTRIADLSNNNSLIKTNAILSSTADSQYESKIRLALSLLNLDECDYLGESIFFKIPYKRLKSAHLFFQYLRAEFDAEIQYLNYSERADQVQLVLEQAYQVLRQALAQHQQEDDLYSHGLEDISLYQFSRLYRGGAPRLSILVTAEKHDGCEPGFMGIQTRDVLFYLAKKFVDKQERVEFIRQQLKAHVGAARLSSEVIFSLYEQYQSELPEYLVKLDYQAIDAEGIVTPDKKDLKRTSTIKWIAERSGLLAELAVQAYQFSKKRSFFDINTEAVLEVIGNDIAGVFGLQVQEQQLYLDVYPNGFLKFMLKAAWLNDAKRLKVAGDEGNRKYLVSMLEHPIHDVMFVSDKSIVNLSEYLALFAVQGDRDAIGSCAQNKLRIGDRLIGIDFGKAYQGDFSAVIDMRFDFTFNSPEFKNYSIFYDCLRSELMRGVLKVAKLHGEILDPEILKSYGGEFVDEINLIMPHADETIFDDYIGRIQIISNAFSGNSVVEEKNKACCEEMIKRIKKAKENAIKARQILVDKFRPYFTVEANVLNLMQNLEGYWSGETSLRSPDSRVLLRHLRVIDQKVVDWKVDVSGDRYALIASFSTASQAAAAVSAVSILSSENIKLDVSDYQLTISFKKIDLKNVYRLYSAEIVKAKHHLSDYQIQLGIFRKDQCLKTRLSSFEKYQVAANLVIVGSGYQLSFLPVFPAEKIDPIFEQVIKFDLHKMNVEVDSGMNLLVKFPKNDLVAVWGTMVAIHHFYEKQKLIASHADVFNACVNVIKSLYQGASFVCEMDRRNDRVNVEISYLGDGQLQDEIFKKVLLEVAANLEESVVKTVVPNGVHFVFKSHCYSLFNQFLLNELYLVFKRQLASPSDIVQSEIEVDDLSQMKDELRALIASFREVANQKKTISYFAFFTNVTKGYVNSWTPGTSDWLRTELDRKVLDFSNESLMVLRDLLLVRQEHIASFVEDKYVLHRRHLTRALGVIELLCEAMPIPGSSMVR